MKINSLADVMDIFRDEFSPLLEKFAVHDLTVDLASEATGSDINRPGVYVYWKEPYGVIKVGKHQKNARTRALEHIRDNTKNEHLQMADLAHDSLCHILLFIVPRNEDIHWVLSLEAFLEWNLDPMIRAGRIG